MQHTTKTWWKEGIIYHIYPQSFYDSNGDGIGDINGIYEKIDYLKDLGVDAVWLGPVYTSPQHDNGYDVADYRDIDPRYGKLDDWKLLAQELHKQDIRILGDLVANHSSHEHHWFREASRSKENPYHDYYLWREGTKNAPPNEWKGFFGGNIWEWNDATQEYYLHMFLKEQPDLNWENSQVRKEMLDVVTFWKDIGIDGFRIDVANAISKDPDLFSGKTHPSATTPNAQIFLNGPRVRQYLQELCRGARGHGGADFLMLGECPDVSSRAAEGLIGYEKDILNLLYCFDLTMPKISKKYGKFFADKPGAQALRRYYSEWVAALYSKAWHVNYFNNHDLPRAVSRFGDDGEYRVESAKALLTISLFAYGTPIIYQGEELGMTNYPFTSFDEVRDVESHDFIHAHQDKELSNNALLACIRKAGRDNARTPMQWDNSPHAGFTTGKPWIQVNPNYTTLNAASQQTNPHSVFSYAKRLIAYRKKHPSLIYAPMEVLQPQRPEQQNLFSFSRKSEEGAYLVLANLSEESIPITSTSTDTKLIFSNYDDAPSRPWSADLRPWESRILLIP